MAVLFPDPVDAADAACEICERGMRLCTERQFVPGAVLEITFACDSWSDPLRAEGTVVECTPDSAGRWVTTLLFLEISRELRASLGMVYSKLSFE